MAYLAAPFKTSGEYPVEERLVFNTIDEMVSFGREKFSCMPESYFAVCTEDSNFYVYSKKDHENVSGGWSLTKGLAQNITTADIVTTTAWGGISAQTEIPAGTEFNDIITSALSPYKSGSLGSVSLTPSTTVFDILTASDDKLTHLKFNVTAGSKPITGYAYKLGGSSVESGAESVSPFASKALDIQIDYTIPVGVDTTIGVSALDGTKPITGSTSVKYYLPFFYGISEDEKLETIDEITGTGTKSGIMTTVTTRDVTFNCEEKNGYFWIAYDSKAGNYKSMIAANQEITHNFNSGTIPGVSGKTFNYYIYNTINTNETTITFSK